MPQNLADADGSWRWDQATQLVVGQVNRNQTYTEQVTQPRPNASELQATDPTPTNDVQRDLQLPNSTPAYVTTLVTELTASATTPYDRALAIFNYFANPLNNFGYSLNTKPGDSGNDLVDFLTNRVGYCQQYAAAMGVMLRLARVPARVVLGYTHPAPDKNGHFQVTTNDAHAWVEAYFAGVGWVPFDPTPLTGADATRAVALPWAPRNTGSGESGADGTAAPATTSESANNGETSAASGSASNTGSADSISAWWPILLMVLAALLVLGLVPAVLRWNRRRRRYAEARAGHPLALWAELEDTCIDLGIGWSPARSPRQVSTWLREFGLNADGVSSLQTITDSVELYSYGPKAGVDEVLPDSLSTSLRVVRRQLITAAESSARWRMRLWPASLWRRGRVSVLSRSGSRTG